MVDGKVRFVAVKTGLAGELDIEVMEGLAARDAVITGPFKTLRTIKDGDRVEPMSEEKKKALEAAPEAAS